MISREMIENLGPFGWDYNYKNGQFRGLAQGTQVVIIYYPSIGNVGRVLSLWSDGRVTFRFPTFDVQRVTLSAEDAKKWGLAVIPPDIPLGVTLSWDEARKFYNPENELIRKSKWWNARNDKIKVLLTFLPVNIDVLDIILDFQDLFPPLGWVFEDGKYKGLQKKTKVVYTKSKLIGTVGSVMEIQQNCPAGKIYWNFPLCYMRGEQRLLYTARQANEDYGLCVVPDDTPNEKMTTKEARSYLRVA